MKKQNNTLFDKFSLLFLSFFGTGYAPFAPGTVGSLATIPFLYLFSLLNLPLFVLILFTFLLTIIACFSAEYIQKKKGVHDPGWIVIDEVIGMFVTWIFIYPKFNFLSIFLVFLIFRIFDIFKIWPATFFDKKVRHGAGTILDDVVSGIYAGLLLLIGNYFFNII